MTRPPPADVAARIRVLRDSLGLSQQQLATRLGVAKLTVVRWEHGRARPSLASRRLLQRLERETTSDETAARTGGGLPVALTSFVGRACELAELTALLDESRLLTLTGTGGCGKTRLALRLAEAVQDRFPDGTGYVDLAPLADGRLVPGAVAAALGLRLREDSGLAPFAALSAAVGGGRLLLLLDNCEHLLSACAELVQALLAGCPALHVVSTSRELLAVPGEHVYETPPLALPAEANDDEPLTAPPPKAIDAAEAVQLFVARARARRSEFALTDENAPAVAQICRRLDGLPLAIELAAARVGLLSPAQIAAHLDRRFELLVRAAGRGLLARHQTLRAAIDWSWELLEEQERTLFARLSVFAGDFGLEAAEAVGNGGAIVRADVLELLGRLVDKSLVTVTARDDAMRYRLLETLREYGRERLDEPVEREATLDRHAAYYVELAETVSEGRDAGLAQLDREEDNLRTALARLRERGDRETQLRLAATLRFFWVVGGRLREGLDWLAVAREPRVRVQPRVRAAALLAAGAIARDLGDAGAAQQDLEESLELFREVGDTRGTVRTLNSLASIAQQRGDYTTARTQFEEALAGCRSLGEQTWVAQTLGNLGEVALCEGDLPAARALSEDARTLSLRLGHRQAAVSLANLAAVSLAEGAVAAAREQIEQAVAELRGWNYPLWLATALTTLADVLRRQGERRAAGAALREALIHMRRLGSLPGILLALRGCGLLAASDGQAERSLRLLTAVDALAGDAGVHLPPPPPRESEQARARARAALGEQRCAAAVATGAAMTLEEAIACALDGLDSMHARAAQPKPAEALSAREREVLCLLAAGQSNRAIAAVLVLSVRTVERHVENLARKTGAHGRSALTAYAHRAGLV